MFNEKLEQKTKLDFWIIIRDFQVMKYRISYLCFYPWMGKINLTKISYARENQPEQNYSQTPGIYIGHDEKNGSLLYHDLWLYDNSDLVIGMYQRENAG